ncbi:MAG: YlaI family protein [Sporolactobacillus sp.]
MRVKCVLCEKICTIDDQSLLSKRLRNRPIHTFMCEDCHNRISEKTRARWATGKFTLHLPQEEPPKKSLRK